MSNGKEEHICKHFVSERTAELEEAYNRLADLNSKLIKRDLEREEAQEALRQSEARFRALFENNHAVMLVIEPKTGNIVDANAAAMSYYGYSAKSLLEMNIQQINTMSPEEVKAEMRCAEKEKRDHFEFCHRLANGEIRNVEVFSGPVKVDGRTILYSIIHDITDRKLAEDTLQRYERIIESSPDLISLVDRNYHYRMVNNAYLNMFGKDREEIEGRYMPEVIGHEFFVNRVKPALDKAFQGETLRRENLLEIPGLPPQYLSATYHPVEDKNGSTNYVATNERNITDQKRNQQALKRFADRLSLATDAGKIGIWEWDVESGRLLWDDMMLEIYDVTREQLNGTFEEWTSRVHPDDRDETERRLEDALEHGKPFEYDFRIIWPDGQIRHIKAAALLRTEDGGHRFMTGVNWDETPTRQLEDDLRRMATTDPLTGANNRRSFMDRAGAEIARSHRYGSPVTMLTLDIDNFKDINDTYGHPAGDEVLKALVRTSLDTLRITDVFARMGGEEFSAILPETDMEAAKLSAERLRETLASTEVQVDDQIISYTVSIGISQIQDDNDTLSELMRRTDTALYRAKDLGRNRVEIA
ncbi:diguanylate cyclase [Pseudodesulfovibrio sp. zrk46]|uniref:diguanylate cyclase n=1 Tax=Pseudodesulfovibrio sp. zrk46 TaxID=2725288 RepID=UPI001448CDA8|nr:diguanylate cyclase [Pseudodesulfovibrio sp. zrk46]QJB56930.1 diguanylate cyclase [Pseudodesulfovibrio sp. zrk46]